MRQSAEGLALTLYLGIPRPVWDAFWLVTTHDADVYKELFRSLYHLEIGTMVIDDADVEAVVVVDGFGSWWLAMTVFLLTPAGSCPDGCEQTQLP
jgi:hypothetical protein